MASYHYYSFYWGLPLWTVIVNHIHVYCLVHKTKILKLDATDTVCVAVITKIINCNRLKNFFAIKALTLSCEILHSNSLFNGGIYCLVTNISSTA